MKRGYRFRNRDVDFLGRKGKTPFCPPITICMVSFSFLSSWKASILTRRRYFFLLGSISTIVLGSISGLLLLRPFSNDSLSKEEDERRRKNRLKKFCMDIPKGEWLSLEESREVPTITGQGYQQDCFSNFHVHSKTYVALSSINSYGDTILRWWCVQMCD